MKEEFNLSKKRKELFVDASKSKSRKEAVLKALQRAIGQQDKEFIKRLKEQQCFHNKSRRKNEYCNVCSYCKKINKLAGKDLIK